MSERLLYGNGYSFKIPKPAHPAKGIIIYTENDVNTSPDHRGTTCNLTNLMIQAINLVPILFVYHSMEPAQVFAVVPVMMAPRIYF